MSFVLSWFTLAQLSSDEGFVVEEVFAIQELLSEMKFGLHSLCQAGFWFLDKIVCAKWECWAKVETWAEYFKFL